MLAGGATVKMLPRSLGCSIWPASCFFALRASMVDALFAEFAVFPASDACVALKAGAEPLTFSRGE